MQQRTLTLASQTRRADTPRGFPAGVFLRQIKDLILEATREHGPGHGLGETVGRARGHQEFPRLAPVREHPIGSAKRRQRNLVVDFANSTKYWIERQILPIIELMAPYLAHRYDQMPSS